MKKNITHSSNDIIETLIFPAMDILLLLMLGRRKSHQVEGFEFKAINVEYGRMYLLCAVCY